MYNYVKRIINAVDAVYVIAYVEINDDVVTYNFRYPLDTVDIEAKIAVSVDNSVASDAAEKLRQEQFLNIKGESEINGN